MASYDFHPMDNGDYLQTPHSTYLSSGFLTPSSSAYEGRRDSVTSSRSSMSYAQSFSSSMYSPPTPSSNEEAFGDDATLVQCQPSFEGTSLNDGGDMSFASCQQASLLSGRPTMIEDSSSFQDPDWTLVSQFEGYRQPRQSQLPHQDTLPAAADFESAMQALVAPNALYSEQESPVATRATCTSWGAHSSSILYPTIPITGLPYDSYPATPSSLDGNMQCSWVVVAPEQDFSSTQAPTETIMPSDAVIKAEDRSYVHLHPESFDSGFGSYDSCSSPMPLSPQEVCTKMEIDQSIKEEPLSDECEEQFPGRMYVSPTGGKRVKKETRNAALARKRSKSSRPKSTIVHGHLEVEYEQGITRVNGKWIKPDGTGSKKLVCGMVLVGGSKCRCMFARPEHLKRHQETHSGERRFACRLCTKRFGRNDNCLEHYWTHVDRPDRKGRNHKTPLDSIKRMIREDKEMSPENKEKIVMKLDSKWAIEVEGMKKPVKARM